LDVFGLFWEPCDRETLNPLSESLGTVRKIWLSPPFDFGDVSWEFRPPDVKMANVFSMYASRYLLVNQLNSAEFAVPQSYDLFIYARPDVCFTSDLNLALFRGRLATNELFVPTNGHYLQGINDQFAIGPWKAMETYLSVYPNIRTYLTSGVMCHPETLLRHHLFSNQIIVRDLGVRTAMFREEYPFRIDENWPFSRIANLNP
jgi:hypothetical protein